MISLTGGLIDATRIFQGVPKCHRKFRCCYMARNVASISPDRGPGNDPAKAFIGHRPSEHKDAQTAIDLVQTSVLIVSKGARFEQPLYRGAEGRRPLLRIDLRKLYDPSTNKSMAAHVGSHPRILGALLALDEMKAHLVNARESSRSTPRMAVAPLSLAATVVAADQSEEHHGCRP